MFCECLGFIWFFKTVVLVEGIKTRRRSAVALVRCVACRRRLGSRGALLCQVRLCTPTQHRLPSAPHCAASCPSCFADSVLSATGAASAALGLEMGVIYIPLKTQVSVRVRSCSFTPTLVCLVRGFITCYQICCPD